MEQTNNTAAQSATQEKMHYEAIEKQLVDANKKIEELESQLAWSSRSYE